MTKATVEFRLDPILNHEKKIKIQMQKLSEGQIICFRYGIIF